MKYNFILDSNSLLEKRKLYSNFNNNHTLKKCFKLI
jgi:hypothetical protein